MGYKIVRDNDDRYVPTYGVSGQWRESADPISGLTKKLSEEVGEFTERRDPGELYDLLDVTMELITRLDPDGEYETRHYHKVYRRGTFTRGIEWTPIPAEFDRGDH